MREHEGIPFKLAVDSARRFADCARRMTPVKAGIVEEVKVLYDEGVAKPRRPRVMWPDP